MIGVKARITLARLMLIADPVSGSGDRVAMLTAAIGGGVDLVRLRRSGTPSGSEVDAGRAAARAVTGHGALLVVDEAAGPDADADAVCLSGSPTGPTPVWRQRLGPFTKLGAAATDAGSLRRLLADPLIDFVVVDAEADLGLVAEAAGRAPVGAPDSTPWFAAGEFDPTRLEEALEAGARRIAVSRTLTEAADPAAVAAGLSARLAEVWSAEPELIRLTFAALADQA